MANYDKNGTHTLHAYILYLYYVSMKAHKGDAALLIFRVELHSTICALYEQNR